MIKIVNDTGKKHKLLYYREGISDRVHTVLFLSLGFFFPSAFRFSFSFLPLDGSDGAGASQRRLGQELIMNNKRVCAKEISDISILFTFLGDITYIASDSGRRKSL